MNKIIIISLNIDNFQPDQDDDDAQYSDSDDTDARVINQQSNEEYHKNNQPRPKGESRIRRKQQHDEQDDQDK